MMPTLDTVNYSVKVLENPNFKSGDVFQNQPMALDASSLADEAINRHGQVSKVLWVGFCEQGTEN